MWLGGNPGETTDIGVFGRCEIGAFAARGDRAKPGKPIPGESGGEAMVPIFAPSLGIRGVGGAIGRSDGRGLLGSPGLISGGEANRRSVIGGDTKGDDWPSIAASESGGDRWRICSPPGDNGIMCFGLEGRDRILVTWGWDCPSGLWLCGLCGSGAVFLALSAFSFFDRLRFSRSFMAAISRSLSSSSLVFLLPRSNAGISFTSSMSS